ncbi:MAG TPA: agmatinase [Methylomirabilota bacterium]|jgi:agmatinase|nr:agmatinase [Methylomirabilota bacterium]
MALISPRPPFIACRPQPAGAAVVLYGIPFEGRVNQRKGAALGPGAIRRASDLIETYAPALGLDLTELALADAGDVPVAAGEPRAALAAVRAELEAALDPRQRWIVLGGDHTVTAPVVEVALRHYPDLRVVQFDAHPDLRREFLGESWNYASAMSRVLDRLPPDRLYQIGLRTGDREEWAPPRGTHVYPGWAGSASQAAAEVAVAVAGHPLYVTIDIDVLDPAIAPGTGSPEPGGIAVADLLTALRYLGQGGATRVIGFDLVEVSPIWDPTGRTSITAATIVREAILTWWAKTGP